MGMFPSADLLKWLRDLPARRALHTLRLIAALLRKHREQEWPARLSETAERLHRVEDSGGPDETVSGMQEILGFFGDTRSLRDVYLTDEAGHKIKPKDVPAVNAYLRALRTQLYLSARQAIARVKWRLRRR